MKKTTKILLLCPNSKNRNGRAGGIGSWAKKYLATFPDSEFELVPVNIAPKKFFGEFKRWDRQIEGVKTIVRVFKDVRKALKDHPEIKLMHTTTSGSLGSLRDYIAAKLCKRHGIKCIMHCRFGTIKEFYLSKGSFAKYFRKNMKLYDQIWVLDRHSEEFLKSQPGLEEKIFLTPNSIDVPENCDLQPKSYLNVGFVGNVLPTKGIVELAHAICHCSTDTILHVAGTGPEATVNEVKRIAEASNGRIKVLGVLPNEKAVELMETLDIISLPTYYAGEAFPISILEAMSRGKLVISCPRAAIPDMLTAVDGTPCGVLVPEKSSDALAEAITWCQKHKNEADDICRKAYEKVKECYRKEVVYEIYRTNYRKALDK